MHENKVARNSSHEYTYPETQVQLIIEKYRLKKFESSHWNERHSVIFFFSFFLWIFNKINISLYGYLLYYTFSIHNSLNFEQILKSYRLRNCIEKKKTNFQFMFEIPFHLHFSFVFRSMTCNSKYSCSTRLYICLWFYIFLKKKVFILTLKFIFTVRYLQSCIILFIHIF